MPTDPITNGGWIGLIHDLTGIRVGMKLAVAIDQACGVESRYGPARYADAIVWYRAHHKRAW